MTKQLSLLRWLGLAVPFSLAVLLAFPWVLNAFNLSSPQVQNAHSFLQRLFASPISYLPILLVLTIALGVAIWPGDSRLHRSIFSAGILVGLGLASMWGFDGGLGNCLCVAGLGLLSFVVAESGRLKLSAAAKS